MKKDLTDRMIEAMRDARIFGIPMELAAAIHNVPYDPITPEEQEAIDFYDSLTEEEKADIIEIDGHRYIRKVYERNKAIGR